MIIKLKDLLLETSESRKMVQHLESRRWKFVGGDREGMEFESPDGKVMVRIDDEGNWDGMEPKHHDSWKFGGYGLASLGSTFK